MVLILSSDDDRSTFDIIDWLSYYKKEYIVLYNTDFIEAKLIDLNNKEIVLEVFDSYTSKKKIINLNSITSYWYRRGELQVDVSQFFTLPKNILESKLDSFLKKQVHEMQRYIYYILESKKGFGRFSENFAGKLINLDKAQQAGLLIPQTSIVTGGYKSIKTQLARKKYITKLIESDFIKIEDYDVAAPTVELNFEKETDLDKYKASSLIQEQIKKKYELRIFHLDKKNFASAIFSQNNEKTRVDFRNYDRETPNRLVPYTLPQNIDKAINKFMSSINMRSGSIDIIVDDNLDYYFLEVNPIGQFNMVSGPCNYNIEKYIADYLIS